MTLSLTELLGFLTGAACVWLLARQNIWNWPLGIANGFFYVIVFVHSGLYGDAGLQFVYITMNAYGWYTWLRPGEQSTGFAVTRTPRQTWMWLLPSIGIARFAAGPVSGQLTPIQQCLTGTALQHRFRWPRPTDNARSWWNPGGSGLRPT